MKKTELLLKRKMLPEGTIRTYNGKKYQKKNKKWIPYKGEKKKVVVKKKDYNPTKKNVIVDLEAVKIGAMSHNKGVIKYLKKEKLVKLNKKGWYDLSLKGQKKLSELKYGTKEDIIRKLAIKKEKKQKVSSTKKSLGFKRIFKLKKEEAINRGDYSANIWMDTIGEILEGFGNRKEAQDYFKGQEKDAVYFTKTGYEVNNKALMDALNTETSKFYFSEKFRIPKKGLSIKKKQSTSDKTLKKPEKKTKISEVTQQYIKAIKKISIMNETGKRIYMDILKEAIGEKDKKKLDSVLKEIKNWVKRDKNFKAGKKLGVLKKLGRPKE